jgi:hypothetical protein
MQIWKKVLKVHGYLSHNSIFRGQKTVLYQKASAEFELVGFVGGCSSVGRAVALQAIGQEFDSPQLHQPSQSRRRAKAAAPQFTQVNEGGLLERKELRLGRPGEDGSQFGLGL